MANINKIKLSGTTYNIEDLNATKTVELTQAQYDSLVDKDPNTFYIITDAQGGDLSNYYTKSETSGATQISAALNAKADTATTYSKTEVDAALNGKQATLVSGTNIKTINNESILGSGNIDIQGGGGGKAVSGGTNISITTGETADTINCTLPIVMKNSNMRINSNIEFANNLTNCFTFGSFNTVGSNSSCNYLVTFGSDNDMSASGNNRRYRYAFGNYLKTQNNGEIAFSKFNVSSSASETFGDSGNTLFSVGNGTPDNARHNALEIRQNGDIYIADTNDTSTSNFYEKPMIKLQDALGGGGGSSYTAGDGIDITNDVISVTGKVDTTTYNTYTAATDTALASKQTTLTAGTGINITDNVISATGGGGGKAISGGTNISITTGETADTINCTVPYYELDNNKYNYSFGNNTHPSFLNKTTYAFSTMFFGNSNEVKGDNSNRSYSSNKIIGNGNTINAHVTDYLKGYNIIIGEQNNLSGTNLSYSYAIGYKNEVNANYSMCIGYNNHVNQGSCYSLAVNFKNETNNYSEFASGQYNNSVSGSSTFGDSGNTLFSVGNGTSSSARHNAFEIRQNGDIYCSDGTNDVKLQDTITATAANTTALGGLSLVKLTQTEYDNLSTKDSNTLYVIVN